MATHHAAPNEIVDLETWAMDINSEKSKVIFRTKEMEVARLVIPAGKEFKEHKVSGPIVVECIKGSVIFSTTDRSQELKSGQLLYLLPDESHSLEAKEDSIILLTIIFNT